MNSLQNKLKFSRACGFSLVEILVVLTLSAMILSSVILIYGRVRSSAAAITARLETQNLPEEILQKIAEDIDRLASPGFDASVTINNKLINGYNSARLIIENKYYGNGTPPVAGVYEKIIWQTEYIPEDDRLMLYRYHGGLNQEDKVVGTTPSTEEEKARYEVFVPVCPGLTHFYVGALNGTEEMQPAWREQIIAPGIVVGLSTTPLVQMPDGSFYLPEETIVWRTVATDRTRQIAYEFVAKKFDAVDPNSMSKENDPNSAGNRTSPNTSSRTANEKKVSAGPVPNRENATL